MRAAPVVLAALLLAPGVARADSKLPFNPFTTLETYFDLEGATLSDATFEDDTREVGEKKLACKKVAFTWKRGDDEEAVTAWFSADVKAGALVAFEMKGQGTWKLELAGSGTGEAVDLGEAPGDLLGEEMLGDPVELTRVPKNPFADAKVGDWTAYRVDLETPAGNEALVLEYEVEKIAHGQVTLAETAHNKGNVAHRSLTFSRTETPTLADLTIFATKAPKGSLSVRGFKVADDTRTVDERDFACQRVSGTVHRGQGGGKVKLWLASDLKAPGFVALEIKSRTPAGDVTVTFELAGYGDDDKTIWGKTGDELAKRKKKSE